MVKDPTEDIDLGARQIEIQAKELSDSFVKVGLQGKSGQKPHGKKFNKATVVDVGIMNEFGTKDIPARSFMRSTFDNKNRQWSFLTKVLLGQILLRRIKTSKALGILGLKLQADTKRKIRSNVPPANAESTLKAKLKKSQKGLIGPVRAPKTLIDTGRMLNAITFVKSIAK